MQAYIQKAKKLAGTIFQPRKIGRISAQISTTRFCDKSAQIIEYNEFCDKIAYLFKKYDICV